MSDKWQALKVNMTYEQARTTLECGEGVLQMLYAESNGTAGLNSIYTWKNMLMGDDGGTPIGGIVHQLSFTGDKLRAKEYTYKPLPDGGQRL